MKIYAKLISILLFLSVLIMFVSCEKQNAEWKGTIEEVDDVQLVKNPEKSLSKNAGRVLKLKEVLRITDESGDYYFKYPEDLKVAHDGRIFFRDEEQILKFSLEGKFISNFFKKGQGPGEISGWNKPFALCNDEIYIYDSTPNKIIHFNKGGNLIEEFSFKLENYRNFYGILDGSFIFP